MDLLSEHELLCTLTRPIAFQTRFSYTRYPLGCYECIVLSPCVTPTALVTTFAGRYLASVSHSMTLSHLVSELRVTYKLYKF